MPDNLPLLAWIDASAFQFLLLLFVRTFSNLSFSYGQRTIRHVTSVTSFAAVMPALLALFCRFVEFFLSEIHAHGAIFPGTCPPNEVSHCVWDGERRWSRPSWNVAAVLPWAWKRYFREVVMSHRHSWKDL